MGKPRIDSHGMQIIREGVRLADVDMMAPCLVRARLRLCMGCDTYRSGSGCVECDTPPARDGGETR